MLQAGQCERISACCCGPPPLLSKAAGLIDETCCTVTLRGVSLQVNESTVVAGGGGFIGGHLVADLIREGVHVRAIDVKPPDDWYQRPGGAEFRQLDLRHADACHEAVKGASRVYNLA